jgi:outer membrane lipoprotein-sorting protein
MKIKLNSVALLLLMFFSVSILFAQEAKSLLDEVSNKVKSYDNIVIDFKYTLNNTKENVKQDTRGDITLQSEKYVLNMMGITRLFNGITIYTIIPEDEEVTISTYNQNDDKGVSASKMLTFYENGYNHKMDILQTINGRKIQFIKLNPIDTNAEIKDILLGIDMQTKHIYKLIQTDSSGTTYTITVNTFKTNQPISENHFVFNEAKYKSEGYYINNLN